jgi:hypothetical protein
LDPRERDRERLKPGEKCIKRCSLCASANVIMTENGVKLCSTNGREEISCVLVGRLEGKEPRGKPGDRWENIKCFLEK